MNESINTLQADLDQAEESLASITEAIDAKTKELALEQAEAQRLDSLVLLKGDTQAMLDLVAVRATINGINEHIQELTRAQSAASARRDEREAELLEAQVSLGDIDGYLKPEEVTKATEKAQAQIDKYAHELFAKLDKHNEACKELTSIAKRAKALRGEQVRWDYEAGNPVSLDSIHGTTSGNTLKRYEAPRIAQADKLRLQAIREAADLQREAIEMSGFMASRTMTAS